MYPFIDSAVDKPAIFPYTPPVFRETSLFPRKRYFVILLIIEL